jgi:hypothetical protein
VRILAVISLVVMLACAFGATATVFAQDDVMSAPTPAFAEDAPPLLPVTQTAGATVGNEPLRRASSDEPLLIAAFYWLLLGGVALRRAQRRGYSVRTAA